MYQSWKCRPLFPRALAAGKCEPGGKPISTFEQACLLNTRQARLLAESAAQNALCGWLALCAVPMPQERC